MFGHRFIDRTVQVCHSPVTFGLALHWEIGISFMLAVTVMILQLKETLHPAILRSLVRSPEPHQNLLLSFLEVLYYYC